MKEVTPDDLTGEEQFEMEAAFGKDAVRNGDIVQLEPDDLVEPPETRYPMADAIEVGDHLVIGSKRHDRTIKTGVVEEMTEYSMTLDVDPEYDKSGYSGFNGFGGERGTMFVVEQINGEPVDLEYGEVVVDD